MPLVEPCQRRVHRRDQRHDLDWHIVQRQANPALFDLDALRLRDCLAEAGEGVSHHPGRHHQRCDGHDDKDWQDLLQQHQGDAQDHQIGRDRSLGTGDDLDLADCALNPSDARRRPGRVADVPAKSGLADLIERAAEGAIFGRNRPFRQLLPGTVPDDEPEIGSLCPHPQELARRAQRELIAGSADHGLAQCLDRIVFRAEAHQHAAGEQPCDDEDDDDRLETHQAQDQPALQRMRTGHRQAASRSR